MDPATHVNVLMPRQSAPGSNRDQGSNSASGIVSTLVPTLLIALAGFAVFLIFRKKLQRVYEPRTMTSLVPQHQKIHRAQGTLMGWLTSMRTTKDADILKVHSIDAYLWLRFLKMLTVISFAGALLTWPILFPVNATGGGGQSELDVLSFSNVVNANRYYAHALVAWLFLGFVVYVITRERINFVGLRQAYYLSPLHALRLSSRTVLFLTLPEDHLSMTALRESFPGARKIWMAPDCKELQELVDERNKEWQRLEKAQTKMMQAASKQASKKPTNTANPLEGIKTPTHRLKFLIGKKVDTIPHSRGEMTRLNTIITQLQDKLIDNKGKLLTATFIEFDSQIEAQKAYQFSFNEKRTQWNPRHIGVQPGEVIWDNLGTTYAFRKSKMLIATTIIYLMVLFWTIPVAVVGAISNINYLVDRVSFLSFINNIPPVILGVVTGLLPVILLAALMAFVPIFCRLLAKYAGAATLSEVEMKTQDWYFVFQVVQVFLITTFASGAASVVTDIINNPASAVTLLAENLPKASNFYLSYFILQGLMASMLQFLNIVPFLFFQVLGSILDKTPRKKYSRWMALQGLGWGSVYPKFTNLGVIALAYSGIAPLVLGFATIGFALLYVGFRYNFMFVYGMKVDMKGESYGLAMKQLMTGVYLSSICLLGLFAIKIGESRAAIGPLVLMIIFLAAITIWNIFIDRALAPVEDAIPIYRLEKNQHSQVTAEHVEKGKGEDEKDLSQRPSASGDSLPMTTTTGGPSQNKTGNALTNLIYPYIDKSYENHRNMLASAIGDFSEPERYTAEDIDVAYQNPALSAERDPIIWLPRDRLGLSAKFTEENRAKGLQSTDERAWFNTKDKVEWSVDEIDKVPIYEEPKIW